MSRNSIDSGASGGFGHLDICGASSEKREVASGFVRIIFFYRISTQNNVVGKRD